MANQEQHNGDTAGVPAADAGAAAPTLPGRRRFSRAGLAATGVILTLNSQPGMAANLVCRSPSGHLSGPMKSNLPIIPDTCSGRSPGYWKNYEKHIWPIDRMTPFKDLFPSTLTAYTSSSLYAMLTSKEDKHNLGMHLVAAYLNALMGWSPFLPATMVQNMWNEWVLTGAGTMGYYTPTAGVKWYAADIVDYVKNTFDKQVW